MKEPKTNSLIPALDLLQARLERGECLAKQDKKAVQLNQELNKVEIPSLEAAI